MSLSIKVKTVYPIGDMRLLVEFENKIKKTYDVNQLVNQFQDYKTLKDNSIFDTVQVDCGGYAVAWNDYLDISECELWENGVLYDSAEEKIS